MLLRHSEGVRQAGSPSTPLDRQLDILQGICHAFGSAEDLEEATGSTVRWTMAALGSEASTRVSLSNPAGMLVSAAASPGMNGTRTRSAQRRLVFDRKEPILVTSRRADGAAVAFLPLVSRGEPLGVLEVTAGKEDIRKWWGILEAIASQTAITVRRLRERDDLQHQVSMLQETASLVRELVSAETPEAAARLAVRLSHRLVGAPVAAWVGLDRSGLVLASARGLGSNKRAQLLKKLGRLPHWAGLDASRRDEIISAFSEVAGTTGARAIEAGTALVIAGGSSPSGTLDLIASLLSEMLHHMEAVSRAERRNEQLDIGLAWTAHEVRGPLLGAKAAIDHLLESNNHQLSGHDLLSRSRNELGDLAALVDPLLRWAVGAEPLQCRRVDLTYIVRRSIAACSLDPETKRVKVNMPDRIWLSADPRQLQTAMANLIRNALAYTPPRSPIHVDVARTNGIAMVSVRDRGPGIPTDEIDSIFDPLARGQTGRVRRSGRGLGLFIARRVVEAHGGAIWAESSRRGATFRIRLPVDGGSPSPLPIAARDAG
jgi:signal transduction histidine kinase